MILLIDNYDSFTFNLYQYLGEMGQDIQVVRNDKITIEEIKTLAPNHIVLSPGPGNPSQAGICLDVIKTFSGKIPILGICLGCQSMGQANGAKIVHAPVLFHGKTSKIKHNDSGVFKGLPETITVARYHSLMIDKSSLPDCFEITSWTEDGLIMGIRHKVYHVEGLQFHPESIMTKHGKEMLKHFISYR